jgi:hypothetical protein
MPNGGSDCCGTCWFNAKNEGEAGYSRRASEAKDFCSIRKLEIRTPMYTYCGNHPHRRPERDPIPIGPVFVSESRTLWKQSPDTEEVRSHLLALLSAIIEAPATEYPAGEYSDELIVWQLGEFREPRATLDLLRIASFSPSASEPRYGRTRASLVRAAKVALTKLPATEA